MEFYTSVETTRFEPSHSSAEWVLLNRTSGSLSSADGRLACDVAQTAVYVFIYLFVFRLDFRVDVDVLESWLLLQVCVDLFGGVSDGILHRLLHNVVDQLPAGLHRYALW